MTVLDVLAYTQVAFKAGGDAVIESLSRGKGKPKPHPKPIFVRHTLYILPLLVLISATTLLLSYLLPPIYRFIRNRVFPPARQPIFIDDDEPEVIEVAAAPPLAPYLPTKGLWEDFKAHVKRLRLHGTMIVALEVLRFALLGALLGLSIYATVLAESPDENDSEDPANFADATKKKKKKKKKNRSNVDDFSSLEWGEFGACLFYAYNLLFCFLLLTNRPGRLRRRLTAHVDILLFLAFCLFAYRDIYPILTTFMEPTDLNTPVTWVRIFLLGIAGILIPILRPRTYVPADPLNPTPEDLINPEQIAPPLFYIFYEFMTPLVWRAWKVSSLPLEGMPPLADYDHADFLYNKHIENLDPVKRKEKGLKPQNLLWSLLSTWWYQFAICSLMCVLAAAFDVLPTLAINGILVYLQNDGEGALVRPIVWVALLFLAPTINSLTLNYYIFVMTRTLVRTEALLTQLIFDHALRLRMKDSADEEEEETPPASTTPDIVVEDADGGDGTRTPASETAKKSASGDESPKTKEEGITGKINVLLAQDIESVVDGRDLPLLFVYTPIQLGLCLVILWKLLGWASLFGVVTMIIGLPIPGYATKLATKVQTDRMEATDARVASVTEAIGALRIIKMFGWEDRIKARIASKRETELKLIWDRRVVNIWIELINMFLPVLTMAVSFAAYTVIFKNKLTVATVFSSMTVFELLKGQMFMSFYFVSQFVTSYVSLKRINKFLHESEMIDEFAVATPVEVTSPAKIEAETEGLIRIHDATFAWGEDSTNENIINFRLRVPDVTFEKGKINLITGPTGSGKSTFLKALIGELHFEPREGSFFHLPREGGVSYAAQESWVMSSSVKDNILFGQPYDEARYKQVIHDCGLLTDLKLLEDGDETEVGEKGITLSGGQKARITLARAMYVNSAVVLLDDIFSALDTLTSRFILENLFQGDLVKGRTIVLITHHIHLAARAASFMVTLTEDGTVTKAGAIDLSILSSTSSEIDLPKAAEGSPSSDSTAVDNNEAPAADVATKPAAKLVKDEEKSEGRISRRALFSFFSKFGGPVFWTIALGLLLSGQILQSFQSYWLGLWASAYANTDDPESVSVEYWLGLYMVWVVLGLVTVTAATLIYFSGAVKASRAIHADLVTKIFGAYMRFLDSTPVGRIIGRFTKDIKNIDAGFTDTACWVMEITFSLIIKFIAVVIFVKFFTIPALLIGVVGGIIGEYYIHAQLSVKREMSNAKTPLFSTLAAAVSGIVSIRAYAAQEQIRRDVRIKADKYSRAATAFYNLNRWVTVRIDMLGGLFASLLGAFLIYSVHLDPATSGFALLQAIAFSSMILVWVRLVNEMEVQGNAVERIEDYLIIDQEPASVKSKTPPAAWPTSGEIVLNQLSAKYSADGPTVLDNLNIRIQSGEKVGIVGRTGSGKSTLALALLRMIPTSGTVLIDGLRTDKVNLHDLRSNVTIIPQDPILLSGTLRFNLDPFDESDDATLNDALQASGLGQSGGASNGRATPKRLTLDTILTAGGSNLSQGQRQLVALARALVRNSKVLILDEATASVDFDTDSLIQKSIRSLPGSTTVLTVAHRLSTVMDYDKILVLGAGKVLEFDSPDNLKNNPDSYFSKLVEAMEA
ncbi:hypothetical protein Q8F55_002608 [Vanrija albida]|uniref:ATP-binding cassette transporter n=1 Tax=Vanrija albida TaxID=181172 RepID=A0ABR3QA94_9TREE